jgi:hypothetical protein
METVDRRLWSTTARGLSELIRYQSNAEVALKVLFTGSALNQIA